MTDATRCEEYRNNLKAIRLDLEELLAVLSTDPERAARKQGLRETEREAKQDFFEQLTQADEMPEDLDLFRKVLLLITGMGYASTMVLQHKLEVSYRQASNIIADLERDGLVESAYGFRPHKVLPAAYAILERIEREIETSDRENNVAMA